MIRMRKLRLRVSSDPIEFVDSTRRNAMTGTEHEGGCLCGEIRYRVTGAPISTNVCTCTQCQKHSGSPLPAFATWRLDQFHLLAGTPASFRSSDFAVRQFCARCGSSLF